MKKKNTALITGAFLTFATALIVWNAKSNTPEHRAAQFVSKNGSSFSELADSGQAVPAALDGITIHTWSGDHLMYEFLLGTGIGDRQYWGVYYSPDDVPLPFQNAGVPLSANGPEAWTWRAEGDDHGATKKITAKWYYFEAGF